MTKNGYVYVFVNNAATNLDVYFDNLQVTHTRGPLIEENHYYPFGLTMTGISSQPLGFGQPCNKSKFNGIEKSNDLDLNMYDGFYRNLDVQIGRLWQIDPKPNYGESLYSSMSDNPILYSDFWCDTVKFAAGPGGEQASSMVTKFTSKTIMKNGKVVSNKSYNKSFSDIIARLDGSQDNFVFNFDASATEGAVSYDGKDINVTIGEPGDAYGTDVGSEGVLFEETKHAEQFLDGKVQFGKSSSGEWKTNARLENEVEASEKPKGMRFKFCPSFFNFFQL